MSSFKTPVTLALALALDLAGAQRRVVCGHLHHNEISGYTFESPMEYNGAT